MWSKPEPVGRKRLLQKFMVHGAQIGACAHVTASKDAGNHEKIRGWISLSANPRWKQACAAKAEKVRLERPTVSAYRDGASAPLHKVVQHQPGQQQTSASGSHAI